MCIQAIEIISEALCAVLFLVKVASCCIKKCDDLERNLKKSLNIIHVFMLNRHISEIALYTYAH